MQRLHSPAQTPSSLGLGHHSTLDLGMLETYVILMLDSVILSVLLHILMWIMPSKCRGAVSALDKMIEEKILQALTTMCNVIEKGENVCYDICQKVMDKTSDKLIGIVSAYWHTCG